MCGRYVVTNPVSKTDKLVKSAIQLRIMKIIMLILIKNFQSLKNTKMVIL
jgi:hypothetical protein